MKIVVPKETFPGERRTAMTPAVVAKLVKVGAEVAVEAGIGGSLHIKDEEYSAQGAEIVSERNSLLSSGDMVLRVRKPPLEEIKRLKKGSVHVSFLDPFKEGDLIAELARNQIHAVSLEMIPRSTRAQKMDALSSQASLAGYVAVLMAADRISKVFPMMTTPAGTIFPAKVFVIGAGVAGLQAIATSHRLGARVEAFDTRPVVAEQVKSLGAKFVTIDLGDTGQTTGGYARELTEEQVKKQRAAMRGFLSASDVVITTAQVFGKKAPIIVTREMVEAMRPGSIIVDLASESGGNVEGVEEDGETEVKGVKIVGLFNLPGRVANDASVLYANNLYNFVSEFWNKEKKAFELRLEDEIIRGSLITHGGKVLWNQAR